MHKYPYGIGTFIENVKESGIKEALKEDYFMTASDLEKAVESIVTFTLGVVLFPKFAYETYKIATHETQRFSDLK